MNSRWTVAVVIFLTLVGSTLPAHAGLIGYSVQSGGNNRLYQIDLLTGVRSSVGDVGFGDVEGLTFQPGTGVLFGYDDTTETLIRIDLATGVGTPVGASGVTTLDVGLTFDAVGNLWLADEDFMNFYSVSSLTGAATLVGSTGREITALAAIGSTIYGIDDDNNALVTIDPATGATTLVGALGLNVSDTGLDAFGGALWAINDAGQILQIDPATGAATLVATTANEYEGLAVFGPGDIVPEPGAALLLSVAVAAYTRRRRTTARA